MCNSHLHCRCGVKYTIMEKKDKKSAIKAIHVNTDGNKNCLAEYGLGMRFDENLKQCMIGTVGKNINDKSTSSNDISIHMSDETLRTYLNSGGNNKVY